MKNLVTILVVAFSSLCFLLDDSIRNKALVVGNSIIFLTYMYWLARPALSQKQWQQTQASITSSQAVQQNSSFFPEIKYSYDIAGQNYESNVLTDYGIFDLYPSSKQAKKLVSKYPTGQSVTIYVNPNDPTKSVIIPGVSWKWPVFFITLFSLVSLTVFYPEQYHIFLQFNWLKDLIVK